MSTSVTLFGLAIALLGGLNATSDAEPIVVNVNRPSINDPVDILELRTTWNGSDTDAQMRNALKPNAHNRWTRYRRTGKYLIPYVITGSFNANEQKRIRGAMRAIARNTCLQFKRRSAEQDYVDVQNRAGAGCYTMVGRVSGNNLVMLESSARTNCLTHATVVHELLHKIGLWHEQMRFDRDKSVRVHYENIPQNLHSQFDKVPRSMFSTYGVRYDYRSVMHYAKDAFAAAPGRITIQTREARFQDVIGTAKRASRGDWRKVCAMYKCQRCMGRTRKTKRRQRQLQRVLEEWTGGNNNVTTMPTNVQITTP